METIDISKTTCWPLLKSLGFHRCGTTFDGKSTAFGAMKTIDTFRYVSIMPRYMYVYSETRKKHFLRFGWCITLWAADTTIALDTQTVLPSKLMATVENLFAEVIYPKKVEYAESAG